VARKIRFDRYYRYADVTRFLRQFAKDRPDVFRFESMGKSYEGRDIWVCTITRFRTGPAEEKPAFWVDGNIHATEVSGSAACLYLISKLLTADPKDQTIRRLLDTRAFYVCPRLNPDGAEWALADTPRIIRSSTRPYPYDEEPIEGLTIEDIDGDGRMLQMRIEDPNGAWKPHPEHPHLMIPREPGDEGGTYYRILPEGTLKNYDGVTIKVTYGEKYQLDMNRNYPSGWRLEGEQHGAGPYPTSEPEIHAEVDFITKHPNITGAVTFHTYSGAILRPPSRMPEDDLPAEDVWTFKTIGKKGTEITGYPAIAVYHEFRYHPREVITGVFDDWMYEHRGVYAWTVEIWSPQRQAGIGEYKFIEWGREHPIEDDVKLLEWSDKVLKGAGHIKWYPFKHPQLGKVELGGWDSQFCWRNPPPKFLEKEIAPLAEWVIWHARISPKLEVFKAEAAPLGGGAYRVMLAVHNTGWLPTYVTKKGLKAKLVRPVVAEISLPRGATLESGKERVDLAQLEGRCYSGHGLGFGGGESEDRAKAEWTVRAPRGGTVKLLARHERAGTARAAVKLS
jgi:murein tripeptide amidase MpaA